MAPSPAPATQRNPWVWIPSLYYAQGVPYVVVMTLSTVLYKNLGISNTDIALYTSWLYLPWVIKPLWSPLVDLLRTKRFWIWSLQFAIGLAFALVALTLPGPRVFQLSLAVFWLMAFSSATRSPVKTSSRPCSETRPVTMPSRSWLSAPSATSDSLASRSAVAPARSRSAVPSARRAAA